VRHCRVVAECCPTTLDVFINRRTKKAFNREGSVRAMKTNEWRFLSRIDVSTSAVLETVSAKKPKKNLGG
jgi:hypothetical protein